MKNAFVLILCFTLLFLAFNPGVFENGSDFPTFFEIFEFGYAITFGTVDLFVSVFKGPEVFFEKFDIWRSVLFDKITLFSFLSAFVDRSIDFLDSIVYRIPVVKEIKHVIDTIILPFEDKISDILEWVTEKIG